MEYKIISLPSFYFAGVSKRVKMQFEGVNEDIAKLEREITTEQREEMHRLLDLPPHEIVNISYDSDTSFMKEEGYLTHMLGVLTTHDDIKPILEKKQFEESLWAVFPDNGKYPESMQNNMAKIYSEWFPSSSYMLKTPLSFLFARCTEYGNAYSEVWMPVIKKN